MNWQAVSNFTTPYRSFHPNNGDKLANVKTFREKKTRQGVDGTDAAARISSCFFFLVFLFFFFFVFLFSQDGNKIGGIYILSGIPSFFYLFFEVARAEHEDQWRARTDSHKPGAPTRSRRANHVRTFPSTTRNKEEKEEEKTFPFHANWATS